MKKTLLLCTFANSDNLEEVIKTIKTIYELAFDSIYVLKNIENEGQYIITYNIIGESINPENSPAYTIAVHRKKNTNTIYTINAINKLMIETIGKVDPNHKIDWEELENTVLVTAYGRLKKIKTKIHEIIKLD